MTPEFAKGEPLIAMNAPVAGLNQRALTLRPVRFDMSIVIVRLIGVNATTALPSLERAAIVRVAPVPTLDVLTVPVRSGDNSARRNTQAGKDEESLLQGSTRSLLDGSHAIRDLSRLDIR